MRTPWIAASLCACSIVVAIAHADPDAGAPDADPMPPEVATPATTPPPAAPTTTLDPKDLASLTNDPILGRANRVMGEEVKGVVAFTFDDGPNPETSPTVIAALLKYDVPATFFIVTQRLLGKHGEKSREVLATEVADGFTIGSHSVTHPNLGHAAGPQLDREIDASLRTLAPLANRPIGLFRPPYGSLSGAGRIRLKKLGLTEVIWSVDTLDWRAHNADKLRKKVVAMVLKQDGGVVLMHDIKPITAKVIADVLDDLEAENCRRLAANLEPIIPVSLHYFLKDGKDARALPEAVKARTASYRGTLPARCARRTLAPTPAADPLPATP